MIEPGTAEWHQARSRGIGGSEVAAIMGISSYTTAFELWQQKTGALGTPDISALSHVQRGVQGEIVARILIEQQYGVKFVPKMWEVPGTHYRCTDDGYDPALNVIAEIKCMGKDAHEAASRGEVPEAYMLQCQYNMFVSKAEECWFFSFRPEDETLHRIVVKPDAKLIKKIIKAVDTFWLVNVKGGVPPELSDRDFKECTEDSFLAAAIEYRAVKQQMEALEEKVSALKESLQSHVGTHPAIRGGGVKVRRYVRKGAVDYAKVPALNCVDLEGYRKPGIVVVDVRLEGTNA